MVVRLEKKVSFPTGFPAVTTGILLLEENTLITGHESGFVVRWDIRYSSYRVLFESDSPVRTISHSGERARYYLMLFRRIIYIAYCRYAMFEVLAS
jgi:hypothetical protein